MLVDVGRSSSGRRGSSTGRGSSSSSSSSRRRGNDRSFSGSGGGHHGGRSGDGRRGGHLHGGIARSGGGDGSGKAGSFNPASVRSPLPDFSQTGLGVLRGESLTTVHVACDIVDGSSVLGVSGELSSSVDGLARDDRGSQEGEHGQEGRKLHCECGRCVVNERGG